MRIFLCVCAGWALSACTVGPTYQFPEIDLPDRYSLLEPVSKVSRADLDWWLDFDDPVLTRLVDAGMDGNLSVAQARQRIREAEAILRRDSVAITGNATASARGNSNGSDTASAGIEANFGLAGRTQWASRAARQRLKAAKLGENEARRLLLSELGNAYVQMRFLQRSLETRQQDLASRRRTLRDLNTLLEAGAATQLDVLRARALVSETRSEVPDIRAGIIAQRNRISTLLGQPVGTLGVDLGYQGKQPLPRQTGQASVPADLLRSRPDIRIAERRYAAAVSDLGVAQASRYPSLNLSGLITAPLESGSWNERIVAGLTMPVFAQPALVASADAAEARAQQAYLQWRQNVLTAVEEVENALTRLQAARDTVNTTGDLVSLNKRALELSRRLVSEGGEATVLDVIDRERSLSAARARQAGALRDLALAYIDLRVGLGIGYEDIIEDQKPTEAAQVTRAAVSSAALGSVPDKHAVDGQ